IPTNFTLHQKFDLIFNSVWGSTTTVDNPEVIVGVMGLSATNSSAAGTKSSAAATNSSTAATNSSTAATNSSTAANNSDPGPALLAPGTTVILPALTALLPDDPPSKNVVNLAKAIDNAVNGATLPAAFIPLFLLTGVPLENALSQLSGEVAT